MTDDLGLTETELRHVLENLACTIHERSQPNEDTTVFHPKELVGILMDGGFDVKIRAVPDYLEQRVGLLASQKVNQVHFLHRSFQEYLAACELICRDPDKRKPPVVSDHDVSLHGLDHTCRSGTRLMGKCRAIGG